MATDAWGVQSLFYCMHTVYILVAFDTGPRRVALGRADQHAVWLGNIADPVLLASIRVERASLIVLAVDIKRTVLSAMIYINRTSAHVPVIVRVRDLETSQHLLAAGAAYAYPETIESSLSLGVIALQMLNVTADEIEEAVQNMRGQCYQPVVENEKRGYK